MRHGEYLMVMALCLVVTVPLECFLGARVWRRPARLVRTLAPVVVAFYAWDALMIHAGAWSFSPERTTDVVLPFGVPVEELVFFIVVPICGLLTFEAVGNVLRVIDRWRGGLSWRYVLRELRRQDESLHA